MYRHEASEEDEELSSIDLREYLDLILKHKWIVVAGLVAGLALGVFYGRSRPVLYHASASMLVSAEAPRVLGRNVDQAVDYGTSRWSADNATFYNSQLTIMRSQAVAALSVREAKLDEIPEVAGTGSAAQRYLTAFSAVRSSAQISLADQERTVWVRATHKNPVAAAAIANALVVGYETFNRHRYRDGNKEATQWLATELDTVETELAEVDRKISAFKKENDLLAFSIEDRRSLLGQRIGHYSEESSLAKTRRIGLELMHKSLVAAGKGTITDSSIFDLAGSATGRLLRERYLEATIELESLSASLGPLHPTRLAQMERIAKLKASLADEARVVTTTARDEYKKAAAIETRLNSEVETLKKQAFALGPREVAYGGLIRKRQEATDRAGRLRERYHENNMAGRVQTTNVRPLDNAFVPVASGSKKWTFYVGASALLGFLLAVGLIILIHQLDTRIHRVGQIEELAGPSFLGALPRISAGSDKPDRMSRFQEAIRIVRTNLHFLAPDVEQRTIMVTSPQPQDGKSTTAYWMAAGLAQMGKKVLLIDADMRSPSLHGLVGIPRVDGLSDLIVGDISEKEAIRQSEFPNVSVMPAGRPIRDPAESLASKRFETVLESLKEKFDFVIVDTPPVLPVADATLLCRQMDVTLMVGRCGSTEKRALNLALAQIRRAKPRALGIIANAASVNTERYYYKGYEGYSYGEVPDLALDGVSAKASQS